MNNSKMTNCRICGGPVAKNANRCPHCGAGTPNQASFTAVIVLCVGIGLAALLMILALSIPDDSEAGATQSQSAQAGNNTASPTETEAVQYIEVTAETLLYDYKANEVNADLLYEGKLLAVTGTIINIGKDTLSDSPCVSLDGGEKYSLNQVQCFFSKKSGDLEQLAALSDGDTITIYGKCTGSFISNVQLSKCSLVP